MEKLFFTQMIRKYQRAVKVKTSGYVCQRIATWIYRLSSPHIGRSSLQPSLERHFSPLNLVMSLPWSTKTLNINEASERRSKTDWKQNISRSNSSFLARLKLTGSLAMLYMFSCLKSNSRFWESLIPASSTA